MGFFDLFKSEPDDWRLVKVMVIDYFTQLNYRHNDYDPNCPNDNRTDHEYTYYLYENQKGSRKIDVIDTQYGDLEPDKLPNDSFVFRNKTFRSTIRPWIDGQYNPEIPSYESIKQKEFLDNLAGEIT